MFSANYALFFLLILSYVKELKACLNIFIPLTMRGVISRICHEFTVEIKFYETSLEKCY